MTSYPRELLAIATFLKKLPGVGTKTAERFAFHLLSWQQDDLSKFSSLLEELKEKIIFCSECHSLTHESPCLLCKDENRNRTQLCITSSAKEVFSIEGTRSYRGLYHVLGGLLSPLEGKMPEHLNLDTLKTRVDRLGIREIIIALDSTLEGDTTALFLKDKLQSWGLQVSRLAFGVPMGSSLEFVDGSTLARALTSRQLF